MNFAKTSVATMHRKLETRAMPSLLEKRNNLITEMEGIINKAKTETRSMDENEQTRFNQIKQDIQNIDKTMEAEQEAEKFKTAEMTQTKTTEQEEQRALDEDKFVRFIKGEQRALDVAGNGSIIPAEIANRIITRVKEISPIYQRATVFNVGGDLVFPAFDENSIVTNYIADMTALTATNGNFTTRKLQNFIAGSMVTLSRSLINRTDFDLVSFVVNAMAQSISNFLERELLRGAGTTAATGIFTDANVTSVTAAGATTVTLDDLISAQLSIPEQFQNSAEWLMNKALVSSLRKMKDADGKPLLNPDVRTGFGWTLLGRPILISENAPSTFTTGQKVLSYGDFSGLYVKLAQNIEIQILNELLATSHATAVVGHIEFDSRVVEDQKIAVMKLA
jgi:HK97 family phage major capsid protein